jgi:PilZ domain
MARLLRERRSDTRVGINTVGEIKYGAAGHTIPCTVLDLTANGAGLHVSRSFGIPPVFQLKVRGEEASRHCRVVWAKGGRLGVSFN